MYLSKENLEELIKINGFIIKNSGSSQSFYYEFIRNTKKAIENGRISNDNYDFYEKEYNKINSNIVHYEDQAKYFIETFQNKIKIPDIFTILDLRRNTYNKVQKNIDRENINFFIKLLDDQKVFDMLENYLYDKSMKNNKATFELFNIWSEQIQKNIKLVKVDKVECIIKNKVKFTNNFDTMNEKKQDVKDLVFLNNFVDVSKDIINYVNQYKTNAMFEKFAIELLNKKTNIKMELEEHPIMDKENIEGNLKINLNYLINKHKFNKISSETFIEHLSEYLCVKYKSKVPNEYSILPFYSGITIKTSDINKYKELSDKINEEITKIIKLGNHWNKKSTLEESKVFFSEAISKIDLYNEFKKEDELTNIARSYNKKRMKV